MATRDATRTLDTIVEAIDAATIPMRSTMKAFYTPMTTHTLIAPVNRGLLEIETLFQLDTPDQQAALDLTVEVVIMTHLLSPTVTIMSLYHTTLVLCMTDYLSLAVIIKKLEHVEVAVMTRNIIPQMCLAPRPLVVRRPVIDPHGIVSYLHVPPGQLVTFRPRSQRPALSSIREKALDVSQQRRFCDQLKSVQADSHRRHGPR